MNAGIAALRRLAGPRDTHSRCGLCAADLSRRHAHLIEPTSRRIECACRACALLFEGALPADPGRRHRLKRIPSGVRRAEGIDEAWRAVGLPIRLAFLARWTMPDGQAHAVVTSPSPLGMVDHGVDDDAFSRLADECPAVAAMRSDIEALLVDGGVEGAADATVRAFVVPIDRCFALAGEVRAARAGLGSRRNADAVIARFFDTLEELAGAR